jgi:hypothetical protein
MGDLSGIDMHRQSTVRRRFVTGIVGVVHRAIHICLWKTLVIGIHVPAASPWDPVNMHAISSLGNKVLRRS